MAEYTVIFMNINYKTNFNDLMRPGSFIGATLVASGITNALIIFHGISGCNIEAVHFRSDQIPGGTYVPIIPTGLDENDCIHGGIDKLLRTLRDTLVQSKKREKLPEVIFILTSDATSIIGDDINTAAKIIENEFNVNVIALDTPGFAGGLVHGTDLALEGLLNKFEINNLEENKTGINIIAPHLLGSKNWTNDVDEIIRLLELCGIKVHLNLARGLNLKNLSNFNNALLNYNLSGEKFNNFEKISNKLQIPDLEMNLPLPIGIANTEEWLLEIANKFNCTEKAKAVLTEELKLVTSQLRYNYNYSWMSTLMHGKYASILAHAKFGASLARCLFWDFGILPKVIGLIAETDEAMNQALELLEPLRDSLEFTVLINPSYYEYGELINSTNVDFAIGSIQDKPLCLGYKIPHLSLTGFNFFNQYNFIPYPNFGIRGVLGLLTELSRVMEEAFYLKDMISEFRYRPRED